MKNPGHSCAAGGLVFPMQKQPGGLFSRLEAVFIVILACNTGRV
jgi:hypothetical protein